MYGIGEQGSRVSGHFHLVSYLAGPVTECLISLKSRPVNSTEARPLEGSQHNLL